MIHTAFEYLIGLRKHELDTPALLIDLDAMERNLARMQAFFANTQVKMRPHVKLHHATPALAAKQLAAGGRGLTCAKLAEAEILAAAGMGDLLIANQIVGERKIRRLVSLAAHTDVTVAVDNPANAADLSQAASAKGVEIGVLVEVNIGHNRCGVAPFAPTLELAQQIAQAPGLRFRGLMGYDGHCTVHVKPEEREGKSLEANRLLVETRHYVEQAGLPIDIVSASGTFTYRYATQVPGITEVQVGSYLLMDTLFHDHGVTEFECALTVLATITSRPQYPGADNLAIIDVGRKTMDTGLGLPRLKAPFEGEVVSMSQEHGRVRLHPSSAAARIGDQLELWVHDCNTTINLYDQFIGMRGDVVEVVWAIPGRGAST
jgi:D-serine deaminase-like pyridoxal phosphate-dependent protein